MNLYRPPRCASSLEWSPWRKADISLDSRSGGGWSKKGVALTRNDNARKEAAYSIGPISHIFASRRTCMPRRSPLAALPRCRSRFSSPPLARHEDEPLDAPGASLGDERLRPSPVVPDQGHVAQVQALQELGHEPDLTTQRQVGVGAHGPAMAAERQGWDHALVVLMQVCDHVTPQRAVYGQPVQEYHDRAASPGVFVLYGPRRQSHIGHGVPPSFAIPTDGSSARSERLPSRLLPALPGQRVQGGPS